jgi:hypothetical protein
MTTRQQHSIYYVITAVVVITMITALVHCQQECTGTSTATCDQVGAGTSIQCSSCGKCIYTINFDDITEFTEHAGGEYTPITSRYGFTWTNAYVLKADTGNCGYDVAAVSQPNVVFKGFSDSLVFSRSSPFRLYSAYVTPAFRDDVTVVFTARLGAAVVGTHTVVLDNDAANLVTFPVSFNNIDSVTMEVSGGTADCSTGENGPQTAIDNIKYSAPSVCGDFCVDTDLGEECDQGPTGGSICLANCHYNPKVCPSTGKKCNTPGDKCCEYYPPGKDIPVQQCYAATYQCVADTANSARKCLCRLQDSCCNQACITSDYACVPDRSSLATKPYCICRTNQLCCNKRCLPLGSNCT